MPCYWQSEHHKPVLFSKVPSHQGRAAVRSTGRKKYNNINFSLRNFCPYLKITSERTAPVRLDFETCRFSYLFGSCACSAQTVASKRFFVFAAPFNNPRFHIVVCNQCNSFDKILPFRLIRSQILFIRLAQVLRRISKNIIG